MEKTDFTFKGIDGKTIYATKISAKEEKAVIQIAHGMAEHRKRYFGFATFLAASGYTVYIHDHRGHGETAELESEKGFFADKNGWDLVVSDMFQLNKKVRHESKGLPVIMMGHSMGSFATRKYLSLYPDTADGVILSGTGAHPGMLGKIGLFITNTIKFFKGADYPTKFIDSLAFGTFNKNFKPSKTAFDWLSRDEDEVKAYVEDPNCGFVCTTSFYSDLFSAIIDVNSKAVIDKMPKNLPYLICSGDKDPVGKEGKGVKKVVKNFNKKQIDNITLKLYPNGRHEMLNETNKDEVFKDILNWLDKNF